RGRGHHEPFHSFRRRLLPKLWLCAYLSASRHFDGRPNIGLIRFSLRWLHLPSLLIFEKPVGNVGDTITVNFTVGERISPVPVPNVGAGLPGLVLAFGVFSWWRRRQRIA